MWSKDSIKFDSFRSLFWLDKKQWYVGYDRCTVSGFSLLYSIPYFMNAYPWHSMKGDTNTISTEPQVLSLNNINGFTVDEQLPTDYKYLRRMTNLQKLVIDESDKNLNVFFHKILSHIDISRITTLSIAEGRSMIDTNRFVQFIFSMPHLRTISASITYEISILLTLASEYNYRKKINSKFYPDVDLNPSILLNSIPKTISNIVVYHPVNITHADFQAFVTPD
ncbi:unnamed protein product [Rotaria magnacalcarata]|nr:unnamed protein product [Rotaria magnacalcarata]